MEGPFVSFRSFSIRLKLFCKRKRSVVKLTERESLALGTVPKRRVNLVLTRRGGVGRGEEAPPTLGTVPAGTTVPDERTTE